MKIRNDICLSDYQNVELNNILNAYRGNRKYVLENKIGVGKTNVAIYSLQYLFSMASNLNKRIAYVDCNDNIIEILLLMNSLVAENNIIIIDNCEKLLPMIQIEKNETGRTIIFIKDSTVETGKYEYKFINFYDPINFNSDFNKLSNFQSQLFTLMFTLSFSYTFVDVNKIIKPRFFGWPKLDFALNKIKKTDVFSPFYNKHNLYYSFYKDKLHEDLNKCNFIEKYKKIFLNKNFTPLARWIAFVNLPQENIVEFKTYQYELFSDALQTGEYKVMYSILIKAIEKNSIDKNIFSYELGTLSFHLSEHLDAFHYYKNYMRINDIQGKLGIVESLHGCDKKTIDEIGVDLDKFLYSAEHSSNEFYMLQAEYWKIHINFEKGDFDIDAYKGLIKKIKKFKPNKKEDKYRIDEMLKRCCTESLRCCHANISKSKEIIHLFRLYLSNCPKEKRDYYTYSYILAGEKHYIDSVECALKDLNATIIIEEAISLYDKALMKDYQDFKSKLGLKIKQAELIMMDSKRIEEASKSINLFIDWAQSRKVDVHIAYGKSLLAKAKIIEHLSSPEQGQINEPLQDIMRIIDEAKDIYENYESHYGIMRLDFLRLMYEMFFLNEKDINDKINELLLCAHDGPREKKFINYLKCNNQKSQILKCIKFYMFVLQ
ncbi:MAG: hypothetical protein PHR96_05060 [Clostridia bacterium]|nr:hypothetical protein [Clostridia bacterium]